MQRLTLSQLLTVTATEYDNFRTLRARQMLGLAFGRQDAYASLSYVELDALALVLAETLTKPLGRKTATHLVHLECDRWAEAVAIFETNYQDAFWVIGNFQDNKTGKLEHLTGATNHGNVDAVGLYLSAQPQTKGKSLNSIHVVNVAPLIRVIQKTAAQHGINLLDPWLPPHNSAEFNELFAPYSDARDHAITKVTIAKAGRTIRTKIDAALETEGTA